MSVSALQVHVDSALSDFATSYTNTGFIADQVCPLIPTDKRSDKFFTKSRKDVSTPVDDLMTTQGEAAEISYDVGTDNFSVSGRALKDFVSASVVANADAPLSPEEDATANVMQRLMIKREVRVQTLLQTAANFPTANKATVSNVWSDKTSGTPLSDIQTGIEAIPFSGDDGLLFLIMSLPVWHALRVHPDLLSLRAGGGTMRGQVSREEAAEALDVDQVFVSRPFKNTAQRGQATATYARIWSETQATIVFVPTVITSPVTRAVSIFSATFRVNPGIQVRTWEKPERGLGGSEAVQVEFSDDEKIIQSDMGYLLSSVLS